jgi:Asp-tRNA(Asn)/Glu-tRNA(Gln) amidotransferase A subunit family amidase
LDLASGSDIGAPYASPPQENFLTAVQNAEGSPRKKIAFTKRALFGNETHPDNESALMHTVQLLQDLGHTVEEACPDYDQERLTYAYYIVVSTGVGLGVRQMESKLGRKIRLEELEMSTWALEAISNAFTASEYSEQVDFIHRETRRVAHFFEKYDALLTPTAAKPPVEIGSFKLSSKDKMQIHFFEKIPPSNAYQQSVEGFGYKCHLCNTQYHALQSNWSAWNFCTTLLECKQSSHRVTAGRKVRR